MSNFKAIWVRSICLSKQLKSSLPDCSENSVAFVVGYRGRHDSPWTAVVISSVVSVRPAESRSTSHVWSISKPVLLHSSFSEDAYST